jgi:hypothetical protein
LSMKGRDLILFVQALARRMSEEDQREGTDTSRRS